MGKFVAETSVEALEYDFAKYLPDDPDAVGVIPEPTTGQLEAYFNSMRAMASKIRDLQQKVKGLEAQSKSGEEVDNDEMERVLAEMDELSFAEYQGDMVAAVSDLCSNKPTVDQIGALPFRVKQAFIQWITGEFRPEAQAPTTRG